MRKVALVADYASQEFTAAEVYGRHYVGGRWVAVFKPCELAADGRMVPVVDTAMWAAEDTSPLYYMGEPLQLRNLPVVTADGEPSPVPGYVSFSRTPKGRVRHAWYYGLESAPFGRGETVALCKRTAPTVAAMDASWFTSSPDSCKRCREEVLRRALAL